MNRTAKSMNKARNSLRITTPGETATGSMKAPETKDNLEEIKKENNDSTEAVKSDTPA